MSQTPMSTHDDIPARARQAARRVRVGYLSDTQRAALANLLVLTATVWTLMPAEYLTALHNALNTLSDPVERSDG